MDTALHWTGWACFLTGVPTSTLLLWLIRNRTSKDLRPYGKILTQAALIDLAFVLVSFLYTPVFLSNGSEALIYGVGVAARDSTASVWNRDWNYWLYMLYLFVASMATYATPAQFYYRFAVLGRKEMAGARWADWVRFLKFPFLNSV
jgi:Serpentine type 7TM GPCR chemoreceptor Srd